MALPASIPATTEGHVYDVERGVLTAGLATHAVKASSSKDASPYDALVIGAGFAGLAAARDLSLAGKRVLLLEARDRIGGRTWTAHVDGHNYEMGGTWIHWLQPHVWAEVTRYGLTGEVKTSTGMSEMADVSYLNNAKTGFIKERPEITDERLLPLLAKFLDVDGARGRTLFPEPWLPLDNSGVWAKWDISLQDRLDQLDLSKEDGDFLLSWLAINTCSSPAKSSFLNLVRLLALSGHEFNLFMEICGRIKLKEGTTKLASAIFSEYKGDALFGRVVKSVLSNARDVEVATTDGETFFAKQVVCTLPLHCLADVEFSPPLPAAFKATRHANFCDKIHVHSSAPVDPWFGVSDGYHLVVAAFTESPSATGGTHLVSFSNSNARLPAPHRVKDDPEAYISALQNDVLPESVTIQASRLVWHDWTADRFSKGAWASYGPGQLSAGLGEIMRSTQLGSNILLASADWAQGWVGYIDGALEMGRKAARDTALKLEASPATSKQ